MLKLLILSLVLGLAVTSCQPKKIEVALQTVECNRSVYDLKFMAEAYGKGLSASEAMEIFDCLEFLRGVIKIYEDEFSMVAGKP